MLSKTGSWHSALAYLSAFTAPNAKQPFGDSPYLAPKIRQAP